MDLATFKLDAPEDYRNLAKALRRAADCADRIAAVGEDERSTQQDMNAAIKALVKATTVFTFS